jgi:DNA repair protein SbcC/Rad50
MRIESVQADAFGPFRHRSLHLAPGMTVVCGPNESGKSSWHAALFAGLCGMRRGRGAQRKEDREFAERHRPWQGEDWRVGTVVVLEDGRRIEFRHDLAGLVDCRATDLGLGRDVSDEVMHDGSPDGARLLGLTRETLLPTICVRQADLLGVLQDSGALQEALQRAAATGGTDDTAEQALARIEKFRKDQVGTERRNSTKPLMEALRRVEEAERAATAARAAHEDYLELARARDVARQEAQGAAMRLRQARAASARRELDQAVRRHDRAAQLAARFPDGRPPEASDDDSLAEQVTEALASWERRPAEPDQPEGASAAELEQQLAQLPAPPDGDVEVAPEVARASEAWRSAQSALDYAETEADGVGRADPPPADVPEEATPSRLRDVADRLETRVPPVDPELVRQVEAAKAPGRDNRRTALLATAGILGVAGVGALMADLLVAGILFLAAAIAAGAFAFRGTSTAEDRAGTQAEMRLAMQQAATDDARQRVEAAQARAASWGLHPDAGELRELAADIERFERDEQERRRQQATLTSRREKRDETARALGDALAGRGVTVGAAGLESALSEYDRACRQRARQAADAARREDLTARLQSRRALEQRLDEARQWRANAEHALRAAAVKTGVTRSHETDTQPEELVSALREWQGRRNETRRQRQADRDAWNALQNLLDGATLADLATEVARLRAAAAEFDDIADPSGASPTSVPLDELEAAARVAERRLATIEGQLSHRSAASLSVPEAEEALGRAQAELERLRALDQTLRTTTAFLESARERVHRDVAPQLKASIKRSLPKITDGRYDDVVVDPASLDVRVRGADGEWRHARLLSHGTAEQVYLLLRVALAEHLVTTGEPAPLILDDPTVQSDASRTIAILELLHRLSAQRQVVVFSQEDTVVAWAQEHLDGPDDTVVDIGSESVPA